MTNLASFLSSGAESLRLVLPSFFVKTEPILLTSDRDMRIKRILIGGKVTELPHPFVEEAEWLVLKNHELVQHSTS